MQTAVLSAIVAAIGSLACNSASAQSTRTGRVDILYVAPKSIELKPVYEYVRDTRALEKFQGILSFLRLPRRLRSRLQDCDGVSNAWYGEGNVTTATNS